MYPMSVKRKKTGKTAAGRQMQDSSSLGSRFPLGIVLATPQLHRVIISDDMTILGITGERPSCALGNIPQVTQHGTAMPDSDFGVEFQRLVGTNSSQEIIDMLDVSARSSLAVDLFVLGIVNDITVVDYFEAALGSVEFHETTAIAIAAKSLPGDLSTTGKLECNTMRIGCLLIILVMISTTTRGNSCWV